MNHEWLCTKVEKEKPFLKPIEPEKNRFNKKVDEVMVVDAEQ